MSRVFSFLLAAPLWVAPVSVWADDDAPPPEPPPQEEKADNGKAVEVDRDTPADKAVAPGEDEEKKAPEEHEDRAPRTAKKEGPKESPDELGLKVWSEISGTGSQIDLCTSHYMEEFKKADGAAKIAIKVDNGGAPSSVNVTTPLEAPDTLTKCLRDVAKRWSFPAKVSFDLSIDVQVKAGTKFKLLKPGEQPPPPSEAKKESGENPGFVSFSPSFTGPKDDE